MRRVLLFLVLVSLAAAALLAVIGDDPIFPLPEKEEPAATGERGEQRVTTPLVTVDGKKGALSFQVRDNIDFKSSRSLALGPGRRVQLVRFRLQAEKAIPRKGRLYTLKEARITFFGKFYFF